MDLSFAAPVLALVIGTISLFTDVKTSPHRKGLIVVLSSLQLLTCLVALRNGRASGLEKADLKARFDTLSVENRTISRALDALREFLAINFAALRDKAARANEDSTFSSEGSKFVAPVGNQPMFLYYRLLGDTGTWRLRYFSPEGNPAAALPDVGDTIVTSGSVNARAGYIEQVGSDWINKPSVGVVKPGQRLRVLEVNPILGAYIWFKAQMTS
jgi:hypothetical protein